MREARRCADCGSCGNGDPLDAGEFEICPGGALRLNAPPSGLADAGREIIQRSPLRAKSKKLRNRGDGVVMLAALIDNRRQDIAEELMTQNTSQARAKKERPPLCCEYLLTLAGLCDSTNQPWFDQRA
jgi:hypothetical protein